MNSWPTPKDPQAILRYKFNWSPWLEAGETLVTSLFLHTSATLVIDQAVIQGGFTVFRASGGTDGETVLITNSITSSTGRLDERTARLRIKQR